MRAENAQLALNTILQKPLKGIPSCLFHPMEHTVIDRLAGVPEGTYVKEPEKTYFTMQRKVGICAADQYLAENPLTMTRDGYDSDTPRRATTGAREVVVDGIVIDCPEKVLEHLEKHAFPQLRKEIAEFDENSGVAGIIEDERLMQEKLGQAILKTGYGFVGFPVLDYRTYGYENYFMAYALYPDVMDRHFSLQADLCVLKNRAAARAYDRGDLPPLFRLDFDIADSRGTLVHISSLDRIWFPHFARALEPMLRTNVRLIWHCDGNLMQMVPRLLNVGISGFQGFQYEHGMDYEGICKMKDSKGRELIIVAGVSVSRTLPMGTPGDVKNEMKWLVEKGPRTGLFLGASSSITPGVPWENILTLVQGLTYYRTHGRGD